MLKLSVGLNIELGRLSNVSSVIIAIQCVLSSHACSKPFSLNDSVVLPCIDFFGYRTINHFDNATTHIIVIGNDSFGIAGSIFIPMQQRNISTLIILNPSL